MTEIFVVNPYAKNKTGSIRVGTTITTKYIEKFVIIILIFQMVSIQISLPSFQKRKTTEQINEFELMKRQENYDDILTELRN